MKGNAVPKSRTSRDALKITKKKTQPAAFLQSMLSYTIHHPPSQLTSPHSRPPNHRTPSPPYRFSQLTTLTH